jgi:hypothetical protein
MSPLPKYGQPVGCGRVRGGGRGVKQGDVYLGRHSIWLTKLKIRQMPPSPCEQLQKQEEGEEGGAPIVLVAFRRTQFWFKVRPQQPAPAQSATVLKSSFAHKVLAGCLRWSSKVQRSSQCIYMVLTTHAKKVWGGLLSVTKRPAEQFGCKRSARPRCRRWN